MYSAKDFRLVRTLDEAADILEHIPRSAVIGGGLWMRLTQNRYSTLIDLSALGLDRINADEDFLSVGACVTLRTLETDPLTNRLFGGVLAECVKPIVGVQLRNSATVGGSVYARFGFSDLICALLALDAEVEMYRGGRIPLAQFLAEKPARDILTGIRIPLRGQTAACCSLRRTATDFAVVVLCAARNPDGSFAVSVGARPGKALRCAQAETLLAEGRTAEALSAVQSLPFGSNMRGSAAYRAEMAAVLLKRALDKLDNGAARQTEEV